MALLKCVGCGNRRVKHRHTYCKTCKKRLHRGQSVEMDDVPTQAECQRSIKAMNAFLRAQIVPA